MDTLSDPVTEDVPERQTRRVSAALPALVIGVLGMLVAITIPFAPVFAEETTVTWPKAGQPTESTTAFFVPYEPAGVHVRVPCSSLRAAQQHDKAVTLVSSHLPGRANEGFSVTAAQNHVLVLLGGHEVFRSSIPSGDCGVGLDAGPDGASVRLGDRVVATPREYVREIFAFTTDLSPREADGISVVAQTSNWFENTPTPGKSALINLQLGLSALALALLAYVDWRRRHGMPKTHRWTWWRTGWLRRTVDVAVVGVLSAWCVLGPMTPDDSFADMTIRNGVLNGDVSNYYRWENSSEAPFTLFQRMLGPVMEWNPNPLAMRVPSIVAALIVWVLLSRSVLPAVLPAHARTFGIRALAATSLLAWWLPFGLGIRPEPFVAVGITAVLACVARGVTRPDGSGLALLGLGGLAAGLSVAVSPVGLTGIAPILVAAPQILRTLRGRGGSTAKAVGFAALCGCLMSVGIVAMFSDQSWFGVRMANELHRFYGPNLPWFNEIVRYGYLLGFNLEGDMARRVPVLLTIALVVCVALLLSRGARRLPGMRMAYLPTISLAVSLLLLWLTPSKWTHYFGAFSGVGAAALTAGIVLVGVAARRWYDQRPVVIIGLAGAALTIVAASLAFSAKNNWFLYSHFGVPWGEKPVRPLNTPLPWLLLAGLLLVVALTRRHVRRMVVMMPAVISSLAIVLSVAILLYSFGVAPGRQANSYSVGAQNIAAIESGSCGIVDKIVVTDDEHSTTAQPAEGKDQSFGFQRDGGYAFGDPGVGADYLWGSLGGGQTSTGGLTTSWFGLPQVRPNEELAVSVAGRTGDGNGLALEFGRSQPGGPPQRLGERVLDDSYKAPDRQPTYPTDHVVEIRPQDNPAWRSLHVDPADIPPGADRVRVRALDATVDPGGWIAVTGPRVRPLVPLKEFLRGRKPTFVDWSMTWSAPCLRDVPRVGGGLAEEPAVLLESPSTLGFGGTAAYTKSIGGSFAGVTETASTREIPTRLLGTEDKPKYEEWGHLLLVDYPVRTGGYDVQTTPRPQWGWQGHGQHPRFSVQ